MPGVIIHITNEFTGVNYPAQKLKKLVRVVCKHFDVEKATVDIAVVSNNQIRKLNRRFLNRGSATDTLAFDLSQGGRGDKWFELVVNGEKAISEAAKRGHSSQAELTLYVVHGLLHNLGLDDLTPKKAEIMHREENKILTLLGFGCVYNKKTKPKNNNAI